MNPISGPCRGLAVAALWCASHLSPLLAADPPSAPRAELPRLQFVPVSTQKPASAARSQAAAAPTRVARPEVRKATVQISFLDDNGDRLPSQDAALPATTTPITPASHDDAHDEAPAPPAPAVLPETRTVAAAAGPELTAPVALQRDDAFVDPFGDRYERSANASPAPRPRGEKPQEIRLQPRFEDATPITTSRQPAGPSSDEIERNCANDQKNCQTFRDRLRSRSIQQISLDISPSFNPVTSEWAEDRPTLPQPKSESRSWHSAKGERLATGSLAGYENGRVLVRDEQGDIQRLPYRELSDEDLCYFANLWRIPAECTLGQEEFAGRAFAPSTFTWKASAVCHKPLYFEEVQLERYGHTAGPLVQPALSGAHFFANIAVLPYRMGINPPTECRYPLGYYRPGSCAPWLVPPVPLSVRGGLTQAGAVLGGIYVIP